MYTSAKYVTVAHAVMTGAVLPDLGTPGVISYVITFSYTMYTFWSKCIHFSRYVTSP